MFRLGRHGRENFGNAVSDEIDGCRSGEVEVLLAFAIPDSDASAANSEGKVFAERAPQNGGAGLGGAWVLHARIIGVGGCGCQRLVVGLPCRIVSAAAGGMKAPLAIQGIHPGNSSGYRPD